MEDRISCLPEAIRHEIMSRLPDKDAARTIILSKAWRQTWLTFPILVFDGSRYGIYYEKPQTQSKEDFMRKRNKFYNNVDSTLQRFHNQGLTITQLKLKIGVKNELVHSACPRIDSWMELAKECGVQVLDLTLFSFTLRTPSHGNDLYHVPPIVLEAKSLVELRLGGLISLDQAFLNHPIKFSSLKVLYLRGVHFEDKWLFRNLMTSCPLIEYITLVTCPGIDSVCIHGLSKLKGFKVVGLINEVEIAAPSLENFHYHRMVENPHLPYNINGVDKCTSLKEVSLGGFLNITDQGLSITPQQYFPFTLLRTLELNRCTMPRLINMTCPQLKVIKLDTCLGLRKACIDAPKLYLCTLFYSDIFGSNIPAVISFLNRSNHLEIRVDLRTSSSLDYRKLRELFQELRCRNVTVTISTFYAPGVVEFKKYVLGDMSVPPPIIKHLRVSTLTLHESTVWFPLATCLLWSCRPSIISCWLSYRTFVKVLCETLMTGKDDCFCSYRHIKCWWHDLKDVKVTCSSGTDGNENAFDCKTFLDALPTLTKGDVSFRLE